MSSYARLGFLIAAVAFVADRVSKDVMLYPLHFAQMAPGQTVPVLPFFNLMMVWNPGISYGLFQQHADLGRYLLVAVSVLAAVGLSVWLTRARTGLIAVALGLLIGGALGNAIDRVAYGAVADFVLLYWIPFFPYVFNIADSAIVAGVALLLYDSVFVEGRRGRSAGADAAGVDPGAGI